MGAYARPQTEEQLLAALEEIGAGDGDLSSFDLGLDVDGSTGNGGEPRSSLEAEEIPEVDSPLDEEA